MMPLTAATSKIPMDDFQREFLEIRGMVHNNPEMEKVMASKLKVYRSDKKMKFGSNYLPWTQPISEKESQQLQKALNRTEICTNTQCSMHAKKVRVEYRLAKHKKYIKHSSNPVIDNLHFKKFGPRFDLMYHIEIVCPICKHHIRFVKRTATNRRAARDPYINGPHQDSHKKSY